MIPHSMSSIMTIYLFINSIISFYYLTKYPIIEKMNWYERFSFGVAMSSCSILVIFLFELDKKENIPKKFKHIKVSPKEIHLEFKTKSGKPVKFKAIKPESNVKIYKKRRKVTKGE